MVVGGVQGIRGSKIVKRTCPDTHTPTIPFSHFLLPSFLTTPHHTKPKYSSKERGTGKKTEACERDERIIKRMAVPDSIPT
jgi:hypothetical protein